MNTITASLTRLKRGRTPYLHNGKTVYIFRHKERGTYVVCDDIDFTPGADFYDADILELEAVNRQRAGINITPKPLTSDERVNKDDLNAFYDTMAQCMPFNCECCGKPLYAFTKGAKRCVSAHILPKSEFPTVKTNPNNMMFLGWGVVGVCFCHDDWDKRGAKERSEMKCYGIALERFGKFADELSERDLQRAYDYLFITPQREGN